MSEEPEILSPEPVGIVAASQSQAVTLFQTSEPDVAMERAAKVAAVLADAVRKQKLTSNISGKEYVRVEGWTMLGSLLGVYPVPVEKTELPNGYEVRVEARTRDGQTVGAAWARCTRDEGRWGRADDYAILSMAQTRATSKALRLPLGFIMQLAGYEPTPAEEMPHPASSAHPEGRGEQTTGGAQGSAPLSPVQKNAKDCPAADCRGVKTVFVNRESKKMFCSMQFGGCGREWKTREEWEAAQPA